MTDDEAVATLEAAPSAMKFLREMESSYTLRRAMSALGRNLQVAGGLELARRQGEWQRTGFCPWAP